LGRTEKLIIIKAPPEKIWEMLAFDRFPEWMDMIDVYILLGNGAEQ